MYILDASKALEQRAATDGYQPKFIVDDGKTFLKVQCVKDGRLLLDPYVESLASLICQRLGFPHLHQTVEIVSLHGKIYLCSKSARITDTFTSLNSLDEFEGHNIADTEYNSLLPKDKLMFLSKALCRQTSIPLQECRNYLWNMTLVDVLVCNIDRHFRNFGVMNKTMLSPYFDFGMGMFVSIEYNSYTEAMRQTYIEPYSEDPFDLIEELGYRGALPGINFEDFKGLCPTQEARHYFEEVTNIVCKG